MMWEYEKEMWMFIEIKELLNVLVEFFEDFILIINKVLKWILIL